MAKGKISAKQEEILEYIKSQILERGFPPSVRDICEAVHLKSTSSVHSHLETLEKNGYIHRDPTKPRAIEILDDSFNFNRREMVNVPVIGHVAAGEPLLAEQNIEIQPEWFDAAHPIAVATASSQVDVGATGITASLFNMAASGQQLAIVADKGREEKGFPSSALVAAANAYNNGFTSLESIKGKRIGITQKGSTFHYMLGRMLEQKGMSLDDVELVPLGKVSAVMAALESNQIDGAILNEPNITKMQTAGTAQTIVQVGDIIPYQTSALFFSPEFMKNEDANIRFLKAYNKACHYYYEAAVEKKDPKKLDEVVGIIAKYVKAPAGDIKLGLPYIDRDGKLMADDIKTQIDWYSSHGMMQGTLDPAKVANTTLLEKALAQ